MEQELWCSLILKHTPGLGPRTWNKLISHFNTAKHAVENLRDWSLLKIRQDIIRAIKKKNYFSNAEKEYNLVQKKKYNVFLLSQEDYPKLIKEIPDPPIIIYFKGKKEILNNPCIAVVGSRKTSDYSREFVKKIARELSQTGITVVSGLAIGIDTLAHKNALLGKGSTIAVLGTGIDINYPAQNFQLKKQIFEKGLVITEFSPDTPPCAENFPIRNRVISGLSLGVVVVQAAKKSGSLITAKFALEQNRLVFSIPAPVTLNNFYGNNQLLRNGAILIRNTYDIIEEISPLIKFPLQIKKIDSLEKKCSSPSQGDELESKTHKKIIDFLTEHHSATIEEMIQQLEINVSDLMASLIQLEILGKINKEPGNQYVLN